MEFNHQLTEEQIRQAAYDQGVRDQKATESAPEPESEPSIEDQIEAATEPPQPCCGWIFCDVQGRDLHTDTLPMTAKQVRLHLAELDTNSPENGPHRAALQA